MYLLSHHPTLTSVPILLGAYGTLNKQSYHEDTLKSLVKLKYYIASPQFSMEGLLETLGISTASIWTTYPHPHNEFILPCS